MAPAAPSLTFATVNRNLIVAAGARPSGRSLHVRPIAGFLAAKDCVEDFRLSDCVLDAVVQILFPQNRERKCLRLRGILIDRRDDLAAIKVPLRATAN
jgi:hypothetical protein